MIHIITLIYLLTSLNNSGAIDETDAGFIREIVCEVQTHGVETALEKICESQFYLIPDTDNFISDSSDGTGNDDIADEKTEYSELETNGYADSVTMLKTDNFVESDIKRLNYKEELKKLGFYKEESKDASLNLRNAVLRFQSSCNMTVDGNWNEKYLEQLARLIKNEIVAVDHIENPPTKGKWIVINKTKRILTLYEGKNVIKKYPVSIGNPPSLTPDGKFMVANKIINPSWGGGGYAKPVKGGVPENPLGYRWIGLSYKGGNTIGIHGNNEPYSIGKNISHGCIRMINSDVEELFEIVPKSAPVWVGTESKLKEWGIIQHEYVPGSRQNK